MLILEELSEDYFQKYDGRNGNDQFGICFDFNIYQLKLRIIAFNLSGQKEKAPKGLMCLAGAVGVEPTTNGFGVRYSTN